MDVRKVGEFLAVAFGLSWTSALVLYLVGVEHGTLRWLVLTTTLFLWAPAVAAIAVQARRGESIRERCGLRAGCWRWVAVR